MRRFKDQCVVVTGGATGIRVNAVAPGGTVTPMTNALGDNNPETNGVRLLPDPW